MDEIQHSSAYSSLTNSSTEIRVSPTESEESDAALARATVLSSKKKHLKEENQLQTAERMRTLTKDYNKLLKKATGQIKALTTEKNELENQYGKLMTMNEELANDLADLIASEKQLRSENSRMANANEELFNETQRLSDEEAKWFEERTAYESVISEMKKSMAELERRFKDDAQDAVNSLREEKVRLSEDYIKEIQVLTESNIQLESKTAELEAGLSKINYEKDILEKRKDDLAGENMQLMLENDQICAKIQSLNSNLKKSEDCRQRLEAERVELKKKAEIVSTDAKASKVRDKKLEELAEKNKNLTDWREQLIAKNKTLNEENLKLKQRCQNLEDLLNEEETDINDVLDLIKNMQTSPGGGQAGSGGVSPGRSQQIGQQVPTLGTGPISKFRDFRMK